MRDKKRAYVSRVERRSKLFLLYTAMWIVAIAVLILFMFQNVGDARVINYSGIVRGATQKLIKEELRFAPDDALIVRIDAIIYDLETGDGDFGLIKFSSGEFHELLDELKTVWVDLKVEIGVVRSGGDTAKLFELSQRHFEIADKLVGSAEAYSDYKLKISITFYIISLLLSVAVFTIIQFSNRRALLKSTKTDSLTGILNRSGFEVALASHLKNHIGEYTAIEFDVDDFHLINSVFGYSFGDKLLKAFASAIDRQYSGNGIAARMAADDFIVLTQQSEKAVEDLAALLDGVVRQELSGDRLIDRVTFTYGVYNLEGGGELPKNIIDKVGIAHKAARADKSHRIVRYDEELLKKLALESEINSEKHRALSGGQFQLYLQPLVDLTNMSVVGAEALVRWKTEKHGLLYPDSFIPLFEKNGFIAELDFYMLEKACAYLRAHLDVGRKPISVSVNFSRVTLCHPSFYEKFTDTVHRFAIPKELLAAEVTESSLSEVPQFVIRLLEQLHSDGYSIAMDDFGSGYSSLSLIGDLPLRTIKLDRGFLREMPLSEKVSGVIRFAVELAHALGVKIVCEGVEEIDQVTFLRGIECDVGQGYYFSRPQPESEFDADRCYARNPELA